MPRLIRASLLPAFAVASLFLATALAPAPASAGRQDAVGVIPPQAHPYGSSYGDWSAKWWQWAYGLPVAGHPLFDETGADCAAGQSGQVWFLGGVFNVSGSATRDQCVVPAGKALFIPILNTEWDNICPPSSYTIDELRALAKASMDAATDLSCDVDGLLVRDISRYRFVSQPFNVTIPSDNLYVLFCGEPGAGTYGPLVGDGYYLMLTPLSQGESHTIHFHGSIPGVFTLDITYHLTPGNTPQGTVAVSGPGATGMSARTMPWFKAGSARITPTLQSTWGAVKTYYR
ncbi:MAG: hypothetical protein ACHQ52_06115 [Candidatus Eisenbacteria bacterium]